MQAMEKIMAIKNNHYATSGNNALDLHYGEHCQGALIISFPSNGVRDKRVDEIHDIDAEIVSSRVGIARKNDLITRLLNEDLAGVNLGRFTHVETARAFALGIAACVVALVVGM